MNEIAQDASSVGNALKTISMRIRAMDEETGEFDDTLQTISGDVYELTHGQVSIMQDANTYKDIYTILDDISKVWDSLTDKEHATLTETLFGKHRANIGSAIISNFEQARKAIETMENADGGAMAEMEVIMDSISYRVNTFKETLVGIAQGSFSQDFLKSMVDSGTRILNVFNDLSPSISFILEQFTTLLEFVTKLADTIGGIPLLIAGIGLKNIGNIKTWLYELKEVQMAINGISALSTSFKVTNMFSDPTVVTQYANQLRGLSAQQVELALSTKLLTAEQKQQIMVELGLVASENKIQSELLQTTLVQAGLNAEKQKAVLDGLNLINVATGEVVANKACTKSELEEQLALHGVTVAQTEQIMSTLGMSTANETATVSFGLLTKSIWANIKAIGAWLISNPVGWAILAGTAIVGVVTGIASYNKHQEELRDKALESANALKEQADAMDNLVSQYEAILDSEKTETEKVEELNKWKQTLADTYGITKEKLANLNLEREDGIKLLQEEIKYAKIKQQLDWQESNKKAIDNAKNKIEHAPSFNQDGNVYGDGVDYWTGIDYSISDEIKNLFDEVVQVDEFTVDFKINTDNAIDEYERLQSILTEIDKISIQRDLTESEQLLYNDIKRQIAYLETLKGDMEIYKQNISSEAMIKFEGYKLADDSYKSLGKDSYLSWRNGLLATAEGDKALEKELLILAEQQFPDYAKYFNNLERAKKQFGALNPNSEYEARKSDFLEKLSPEDLEIVVNHIPDLFAYGLEKATAKIDAWKKDPNNVIKPTVDTKPLEEMAGEVSSKVKLIVSAMEDMEDTGHISSSTYAEIIEMGGNYIECLELQDGQLKLNIEKLKELEIQEYKNAISANELEIAQESLGISSQYDYNEWQKFKKQLEEENALYQILIDEIYGASPKETDSKSTGDPNKEAFDTANNLRKHWLAMGKDNTGKKYTEEMYYAWLDSADGYKKYFSDLTKYTDEYRQYEEEIYKWRINKDKELFEERIENYEKLKDKELNDSEYDNPIKKYEEAGKIINQEMSAIQSRIQELVESGSSAVQDEIDSLKGKYDSLKEEQEEIQKDIWDTRVENEKTFWELQKEAVETYYDNEIKKLEEIEDEQERINKKEELRLNLIKAQQELLDAKKNRNQLLFANGGFYYDYDQEAVQKAQENITNAEQDITDFNNDETKRLLEEQRDNEIAYYNTIIEMLEAYINKTLPIETSDSEVFNTAMSSKYAQSVLNKQTEITPVTLKSFLQDRFPNYNKQVLDSGYDLLGKIMNKPVSSTLNAWDNLNKMNAQNYTVNNNNNNSVYIENMPITVPVGTTEEQVQAMIDQFASGVISTVRAKRAKLQ